VVQKTEGGRVRGVWEGDRARTAPVCGQESAHERRTPHTHRLPQYLAEHREESQLYDEAIMAKAKERTRDQYARLLVPSDLRLDREIDTGAGVSIREAVPV
jgi:hypothetical protein